MIIRKIIFIAFSLICLDAYSQNENLNWTFGDSAGVYFQNLNNALPAISSLRSRGSCASVSDSSGNLVLYANTRATVAGRTTFIWNANNLLIKNGTDIVGQGWYHEIVIVPFPGNDSLFYVFSIGVTGPYLGLYYSIADIKNDTIIQKNIQLLSIAQDDCISAVKHGNGRDWWIVGRNIVQAQWNNQYYKFLVTPGGVAGPYYQSIGDTNYSNTGRISFSPSGDTLLYTDGGDIIQYFRFDRCSGIMSNPVTIRPPATIYSEWTWSNEFSPNGRYIYTSTSKDTTQLFQYDLQSPNPLASRVTLYQSVFPEYAGGDVKRGPDGKIYFSIAYNNGVNFNYPYPDSVYNNYNMYLSVINAPDSAGASCNFQPYSFYLGGKRTYYGLPNNPDYHLGPKMGSGCDTLLAINEHSQNIVISNLFPNPNNGEFSINYFLPNAQSGKLAIFNLQGQILYEMKLPRYTYMQNINIKNLAAGIYALRIQSGDKSLVNKFVVQ